MEKMGPDCCFAGHQGDVMYKPRGTCFKSGPLEIYQTKSTLKSEHKGILLYLPDGFGLAQHNLILADKYAANGYDTFVVDYFEGDPLPIIFMSYSPRTNIDDYTNFTKAEKELISNIDMKDWNAKHKPERIWSITLPFIESLRDKKTSSAQEMHVVGHCFGGKYALRLATTSHVAGAVAFHPSFLEQSDLQNLIRPVFVGCAETDVFTPKLVTDLLPALRASEASYHLSVYGKTRHGFASRADRNNVVADRILEESFQDSVLWLERLRLSLGRS